jgi:predicted TIM-barrel enzyme
LSKTLEQCVGDVDRIAEAAMRIRRNILVLCHRGPIATPEDAEFIMRSCRCCHGFYGASSMERPPVEIALIQQARRFKALRF